MACWAVWFAGWCVIGFGFRLFDFVVAWVYAGCLLRLVLIGWRDYAVDLGFSVLGCWV